MTDEIASSEKLFQMWREIAEKHSRVERDGEKTRLRGNHGRWLATIRWQKDEAHNFRKDGTPWEDASHPKLWTNEPEQKTGDMAIRQFERLAGEEFSKTKINRL